MIGIIISFIFLSIYASEYPKPPTPTPEFNKGIVMRAASYRNVHEVKAKKCEWDHQGFSGDLDSSTATTYMSESEINRRAEEISVSRGSVDYEDGVPVTTVTWYKRPTSWIHSVISSMRISLSRKNTHK